MNKTGKNGLPNTAQPGYYPEIRFGRSDRAGVSGEHQANTSA